MSHLPSDQLTLRQQTILDTVRRYPGRFTRSGLAKMLVGAKSWSDAEFPEYGRFAGRSRKDVTFDIDVLLQQGFLALDGHERLVPLDVTTGRAT
jgi:hypothetical protein